MAGVRLETLPLQFVRALCFSWGERDPKNGLFDCVIVELINYLNLKRSLRPCTWILPSH